MSKNVSDLRAVLFDAIESVKNGSLELDKARAINDLSKTVIDTARAEAEYADVTSDFITQASAPALPSGTHREASGSGTKTITQLPGATVTQHKMRG
mgnify:CR=1 FL=1